MAEQQNELLQFPVIPLFGVVAFPKIPIQFEISDDASLAAADAAGKADSFVFLVSLAKPVNGTPKLSDFQKVGTIAKIKQAIKDKDGTMHILCDGYERAELKHLRRFADYCTAEVTGRKIICPEFGGIVGEAMLREAKSALTHMMECIPTLSPDLKKEVMLLSDPGSFADFVAAHILVRFEDKQTILNESTLLGRLEKLLAAQTGERALGLCDRQGVFLCRAARSGHIVAFCTQSMTQEGAIVTLQASAGFAARAVLARPPFLSAKEWMGSPLLPLDDVPTACRMLQALGAQRVLVVAPQSAIHHEPDALEQTSGFFVPCARELGENVGLFRMPLPDSYGAHSLDQLLVGANAGREAAAKEMEAALGRLGLPLCRVLPFRRRLTAP